jgi:hypothetical protein
LVSLSFDVLEIDKKFSCSRFLLSLLLTFTYMDPLYMVLKSRLNKDHFQKRRRLEKLRSLQLYMASIV